MTRSIMIECPLCLGEGSLEQVWHFNTYAYSPRPSDRRDVCDLCHGSGEIEQWVEPIEQEDLDR